MMTACDLPPLLLPRPASQPRRGPQRRSADLGGAALLLLDYDATVSHGTVVHRCSEELTSPMRAGSRDAARDGQHGGATIDDWGASKGGRRCSHGRASGAVEARRCSHGRAVVLRWEGGGAARCIGQCYLWFPAIATAGEDGCLGPVAMVLPPMLPTVGGGASYEGRWCYSPGPAWCYLPERCCKHDGGMVLPGLNGIAAKVETRCFHGTAALLSRVGTAALPWTRWCYQRRQEAHS